MATIDCGEMQSSLCYQGLHFISSVFFGGPSTPQKIFRMHEHKCNGALHMLSAEAQHFG